MSAKCNVTIENLSLEAQGQIKGYRCSICDGLAINHESENFKIKEMEIKRDLQIKDMEIKRDLQPQNTEYLNLMIDLLKNTMMEVASTAPDRKKAHKKTILKYYGEITVKDNDGKNRNRCMVLNQWFPAELIIGAHLFRRKLDELGREHFQIGDVDDPRNGMVLFKPIELAFDNYQVSIIYINGDYVLRVIDPEIKDLPLIDLLDDNQMNNWIGIKKGDLRVLLKDVINLQSKNSKNRKRKRKELGDNFDFTTTFGDLDGKKVVFTTFKRPFHRVLNLHARLAVFFAEKSNKIERGAIQFEDFWSEVDLSNKMSFFGFK